MTEKTTLIGYMAQKADARITIMAEDPSTGEVFTMKIPLMKWVDGEGGKRGSYVEDEDVYNTAVEELESAGLNIETIEDDIFEHEFNEAWVDRENLRAALHEIHSFIRFDRPEIADFKKLKRTEQEVKTLTLFSERQGLRFEPGFETEDGKRFRVSQLAIRADDDEVPDITVSMKYTNNTIDSLRETLANSEMSEENKAAVNARIDRLVEAERENKIAEIEQHFGIDIVDLIENGGSIDVQIEPNQFNTSIVFFKAYVVD